MTVKQLIEQLEGCDPEALIVIPAQEQNYNAAAQGTTVKNAYYQPKDRWWDGDYEITEETGNETMISVVIIS
jgi:hypothetical protein